MCALKTLDPPAQPDICATRPPGPRWPIVQKSETFPAVVNVSCAML